MNPNSDSGVSASQIIALRQQPDALQAITDLLQVRRMGPADHIRTKHEVKAWLDEPTEQDVTQSLIERAGVRVRAQERVEAQKIRQKVRNGQRQQ